MTVTLHNLKRNSGYHKPAKRVGRGLGSGRGAYSGRGVKGQKARSGGRGGLKLKGLKANIQNIPKLPGFRSLYAKKIVVNVARLDSHFKANDKITLASLKREGLIPETTSGVKILGNGTVSKPFNVIVNGVSQSAREAIEKAGGTVKVFSSASEKKTETEQK